VGASRLWWKRFVVVEKVSFENVMVVRLPSQPKSIICNS